MTLKSRWIFKYRPRNWLLAAAMNCKTCKFCRPIQYPGTIKGAYGWCYSPLPFWVRNSLPLILKKEIKGKVCAMHQEGRFSEG